MKRSGVVAIVAIALICAAVTPSWAWGGHGFPHHHPGFHTRVFFGVGPFWWGPPAWYYPPPAYVYAPPVVVQEPPVYVQPPAPPAPSGPAYWYYCQSANSYYPNVQSCPEAWIRVAPRTE
jgi:hypothetical protein